jgi:hypothetical protein
MDHGGEVCGGISGDPADCRSVDGIPYGHDAALRSGARLERSLSAHAAFGVAPQAHFYGAFDDGAISQCLFMDSGLGR